jgi:beta-catenin-like protein 1
LGVFENMLALNPDLSGFIVSKTSFLGWLLSRIQAKTHDENRGYAAELLAILLQNNRDNRLAFAHQDGIELVLQVLFVSLCIYTSQISLILLGSLELSQKASR